MTQRIPFGRTAVVLLSAVLGAVSLIPLSSIAVAAGLTDKLVGTWRLVRYTDTDPSGKVTYPFGENPRGYFVYDPTGHLSVQIMRMPPRPVFASGEDDKGTDAEVRAAYEGYVAYFGTYRVDEANSVVTHVVEGSLNPGYTGTDQPRAFTLHGDVLIIQVRDKDGSSYFRELHRVK
jgi:hypothetical protein